MAKEILLYVREDIPEKVIHCDFLAAEISSVEINLPYKYSSKIISITHTKIISVGMGR